MNPIPVAVLAGVAVVVVPPLRRRVIPVTAAVVTGIGEVGVAAVVGTRDILRAVVGDPGPVPAQD